MHWLTETLYDWLYLFEGWEADFNDATLTLELIRFTRLLANA